MLPLEPDRQKLTQLRKLLIQHFSLDELRVLCFDLGLEYEELPGDTKTTKMQGLIEYLLRRGEIWRLSHEVEVHRPNVEWPLFHGRNHAKAGEKDPGQNNKNSYIHEKSGLEMILIPAGEFLYSDAMRLTFLPSYWISKTPVTNAHFSRFMFETGHAPPEHWKNGKVPPEWETHPVVYISWDSAVAYANWAGLQLPTEKQWEKAARGQDDREYPWGSESKPYCNSVEAGISFTTPVGYYSPFGDIPYGCIDMSGNVWEWTNETYKEDLKRKVLKGGSWNDSYKNAKISARSYEFPHFAYLDFGFRLASIVAL